MGKANQCPSRGFLETEKKGEKAGDGRKRFEEITTGAQNDMGMRERKDRKKRKHVGKKTKPKALKKKRGKNSGHISQGGEIGNQSGKGPWTGGDREG